MDIHIPVVLVQEVHTCVILHSTVLQPVLRIMHDICTQNIRLQRLKSLHSKVDLGDCSSKGFR